MYNKEAPPRTPCLGL